MGGTCVAVGWWCGGPSEDWFCDGSMVVMEITGYCQWLVAEQWRWRDVRRHLGSVGCGRFVVVVAGFSSSWCGASTMAKIDRWGLLVVGSKGFGWQVTFWWLDTCGYWEMVFWCWFGRDVVKGFWRWCGGWISGGGKYTVKAFFFSFFCLVLDWLAMILKKDRCLLWYQNWRRTTRTKLKQ